MMYTIEIEFHEGSTTEIEVEADNEQDALSMAMPKSFTIVGGSA